MYRRIIRNKIKTYYYIVSDVHSDRFIQGCGEEKKMGEERRVQEKFFQNFRVY